MQKQRYIRIIIGYVLWMGILIGVSAADVDAQESESLDQLLQKEIQNTQSSRSNTAQSSSQIQSLLNSRTTNSTEQQKPDTENPQGQRSRSNAAQSSSQLQSLLNSRTTDSTKQQKPDTENPQNKSQGENAPGTPSGVPLSQEELLNRGQNIQEQLLKNPEDQKGLNEIIDAYVKQAYGELFYTKTSSKGEMKILLQNKRLYQGNTLNFALVQEHVNESLDFKNASYTWTVKRGNDVVKSSNGSDKPVFQSTPKNTGPYTVHVKVHFSNNTTKTGRFPIDVYERTNIDYRPLNPGKGDSINLRPARKIKGQRIIWKLDGEVFAKNTYTPSFKEFKGHGSSYDVEVIFKDKNTDKITYYAETTINVQKPRVNLQGYNPQTDRSYTLKDSLTLDSSQELAVQARARSFPKGKSLTYIFRVDDNIKQKGAQSEFKMQINPRKKYALNVTVQAGENGEIAQQNVTINPGQSADVLSASVSEKVPNWPNFPYRDFFVLVSIVGLGVVLTRIN